MTTTTTTTLGHLAGAHDFQMLEHLEHDAEVPVLDGLQAQGDLFIVPGGDASRLGWPARKGSGAYAVPAAGVAVIEATSGGHEHRLFAGMPGTAWYWPDVSGGQVIGLLECTEPAYLLHPEHGATGVAPGRYELRRQREQADEERLVAD